MAEVLGVTVGTIALLGVVQDCIDLFANISAAKSLGRDYEILSVKLDIERTLFLRWSERLFIDGSYAQQLNAEVVGTQEDVVGTQEIILRTLASIRLLLGESGEFQRHYGMEPAGSAESSSNIISNSAAARINKRIQLFNKEVRSLLRKSDEFQRHYDVEPAGDESSTDSSPGVINDSAARRFKEMVRRFNEEIRLLLRKKDEFQRDHGMEPGGQAGTTDSSSSVISNSAAARFNEKVRLFNEAIRNRNRDTSVPKKVRWVVSDKRKFEDLIDQLSYFISKLNTLIPDKDKIINYGLRSDLLCIRDIPYLDLVIQTAKGHERETDISESASAAIDEECCRRILDRLWFRMMDDREQNIAATHEKTFEWALHPPDASHPWDDLSEWFQSGSGVYWLCGKAGSGKSTLMKFLLRHKKVEEYLNKWSNTYFLTVASFFIWNLGTPEQKTQDALARALLFQVLHKNPALIPDLLPKMWREARLANKGSDRGLGSPSATEIREALRRLGSKRSQHRFCFFIDGLDEFSGSCMDGVAFVKGLVQSDNVKVLVSSRPIDVCVGAFSGTPQLELQHLTYRDMETYVSDTVLVHPYMDTLTRLHADIADEILMDLTGKASGVFLWIVLACRSLLEGFAAYDDPEDVQCRIDELPPELEDLFRHIFTRIPPRNRIQGAKLLRICYQNQLIASEPIHTLGLAFVDEARMDIHRIPGPHPLTRQEKRDKCTRLGGRLRSRCYGLLEVHHARSYGGPLGCFCGYGLGHDTLIDSTIEFMHRTVFEFLKTAGTWDTDFLAINDETFDAAVILERMKSTLERRAAVRKAEEELEKAWICGDIARRGKKRKVEC